MVLLEVQIDTYIILTDGSDRNEMFSLLKVEMYGTVKNYQKMSPQFIPMWALL
jgi:hypothetical protein